MNFFQKDVQEIAKDFNVNLDTGLSHKQVEDSRQANGKNEFSPGEKVSLTKKIIEALKEPMVLILLVAAIITLGMEFYKLSKGLHAEFVESIGIIVAIGLSVGIKIIMEGRSEKAFDALNNINDDVKVKALRDGNFKLIHKSDVVVGDIIKIETGDKVPSDARIIECSELKVDESMLTGESLAISKISETLNEASNVSLSMRKNMIFAGTFVTYGQGLAIVTTVGDNTEMGHIAGELKTNISKSTPLQEKLDKLSKTITKLGIIASSIIFFYEIFKIYSSNSLSFESVQEAFMNSVALIVASVPEGLPTIVAMTLALNIIKMAKSNALVRKLVACETVGCINVICSDKTGTLTKNQMTVIDIWSNGNLITPDRLNNPLLIENFTINSTAHINIENDTVKFIGNATECALLKAFSDTICSSKHTECEFYGKETCVCNKKCITYLQGKDFISYKDIRNSANILHQYQFSSDRKSMSTVISENSLNRIFTKGSPEKIISLCNRIMIDNKVIPFTEELKNKVNEEITLLQKEAKRTLGFAHNDLNMSLENFDDIQDDLEKDLIFDGFVSIADPLREDVYDAVHKCKSSGISLKILTGDNIITATSIANQLGIINEDSIIVEANDIDEMSDEELLSKLDKITVIARSKPLTKMRIVNLLKNNGSVVAVTGDGINDAPALKNADVGISMGITGTEVSKEASDIVLLDDSFSTIVKAVEWGRGIYENFQRFIQFQLTVNLVAVLIAFICEIQGKDMPFTTIQLLWVNLIMDGPPALSLGLESLRKHLMEQKPVKRDASILTKSMISRIVFNGIFIVLMMLLVINFNVLGGSSLEQSSIIFTTFIMFQLFNAFNSRELGDDSIFSNLLNNTTMLKIMTGTFALQVFITQFGGEVFRTYPLSISMWIKIVLYSSSVLVFSEVIRFVKRKFIK